MGPLLGSLLASAFYRLLHSMRYQTCNPGQDFSELDEQALKDRPVRNVNGGPESSFKTTPDHHRTVSGATAVNRDFAVNSQMPPANHDLVVNSQIPQGDISQGHDTTHMQPVYERRGPV